VDYLIDLIQSDPSAVLIDRVNGTTRVPASYPGTTMVMRIPMANLGSHREPHPAWKPTRLGEW
jgi:hypothetical protein